MSQHALKELQQRQIQRQNQTAVIASRIQLAKRTEPEPEPDVVEVQDLDEQCAESEEQTLTIDEQIRQQLWSSIPDPVALPRKTVDTVLKLLEMASDKEFSSGERESFLVMAYDRISSWVD